MVLLRHGSLAGNACGCVHVLRDLLCAGTIVSCAENRRSTTSSRRIAQAFWTSEACHIHGFYNLSQAGQSQLVGRIWPAGCTMPRSAIDGVEKGRDVRMLAGWDQVCCGILDQLERLQDGNHFWCFKHYVILQLLKHSRSTSSYHDRVPRACTSAIFLLWKFAANHGIYFTTILSEIDWSCWNKKAEACFHRGCQIDLSCHIINTMTKIVQGSDI